jgi:predicted DsbA family dithiol-disulfide isomerase
MPATTVKTATIEIYSDLICPWCYIGKRKMENALAQVKSEVDAEVIWKAFELNPDMPVEGMNRKVYRSRKFGSWERSRAMDDQVALAGQEVGVEFNYDRVVVTPNTFLGHRLLWWAHREGAQNDLSESLFKAYFTDGRDIGTQEVLVQIVEEAGLSGRAAQAFLEGSEGTREVKQEEESALRMGVNGVPFFIINGVPCFSGAQRPEDFIDAIRANLGASGPCQGDSCTL